LPKDPTSEEFMAAYQAALLGQSAPVRDRLVPAQPGSIAARLEMLRTEHGHRTVAGLSRERIVTGILQPYADRPGAALDTLKKLRILIRHAINIRWLKHDPSLGIKRPKIKRIRSWTDDEIEQFKNRWPLGTKQRMAFHLFLNLGQRRSDVVRMAITGALAGNFTRLWGREWLANPIGTCCV
jgi:hypothetical protein